MCTCARGCFPTLYYERGRVAHAPPPFWASSSTVSPLVSQNQGLGCRACPRESQGAVSARWVSASRKSPVAHEALDFQHPALSLPLPSLLP